MTGQPRLRHDVDLTRSWSEQGTRAFLDAVLALPDPSFAGPSLLPGWTRGHVVTHVARNAEALGRLVSWARTGVEAAMYPDDTTRDSDIAVGAVRAADQQRADVVATAAALGESLAAMAGPDWGATVRTRQGQSMAATLLPWLRVRELWLHAVDLDTGVDLATAPGALLTELVADLAATLSRDPACPSLLLVADDGSAPTPLGGVDTPATTVTGTPAHLVLWLSGRSDGAALAVDGTVGSTALPVLPRWL